MRAEPVVPGQKTAGVRRGACLAVLLLVPVLAFGAPKRPIRFDRLSLEQGLSQSSVNRILQDRRGYIWLATEDGLNRYDGIGFKVYRRDVSDPASLPASFVWDLAEDAAGNLWIATRGGLASWNRASDRIARTEMLAAQDMRVLAFAPKDDTLWVGTRDSGLYRLQPHTGELERFVHDPAAPSSLIDDRIYALHVDRAGRLWVGTDGGLDRLDPGADGFVHFLPDPSSPTSLSEAKVRTLLEDDLGALWVGTSTGGLNRLAPAGGFQRFRHQPDTPTSLAHDQVRALLQDGEGRLWVGTAEGLDLFDADLGTFTHYRADPKDASSLADGHVLSLAQDRGGVLWVGTRLGGAHKWNPLSWQLGHVAADAQDSRALVSPYVTSFSEDRAGRLWVGTIDAGVDRLDAATGVFHHYRHDPKRPDSLSAGGVTTIVEDGAGRLWLGTYGSGLDSFDPSSGRFTHYRHEAKNASSLPGDRVACVSEAADGKLWVGTMEKGLALLDPRTGRFTRFAHDPSDPDSLPSNTVYTVFTDAAGQVWVGTNSGLSRLDPETRKLRTYTTRDGLASDVVYGVRGDRRGRLWLSTNNGLCCFDPASRQFRNYGVSEGAQATEFNFGAWHQSPSGELFFGGLNGFNAFFPDRLRSVAAPPAVVLTAITVAHQPIAGPADQARDVGLGFRDKVLELDFAALDYTAPLRNRFAYRLEGFDPEWVPLLGRQSVTYTNLNPGRYTFRLRGATSDGRWSEETLALPVRVAAAPWATPWAFAGYLLALAAFVLGVVRLQQRKLRREAEYSHLLEQRVQERTRELSERQQELERVNHELAQASITDSLTGLANRRFLAEYIEKEVALLHRRYHRLSEGTMTTDLLDLAFVMIDIDNFKVVNDTAGHAAGDAVLRQFRDLLSAVARSSDIIVRWGGDEFLIVARDLSDEGQAELAERIRARAEQHVFEVGEGRVIRTTCSVGFARYPFFKEQLDALTWEQVVSLADRGLYVAKASGRNAWVGFHPGLVALPIQGLFGAICHGIQQLVVDGTLRVTSSLRESRSLVWDSPRVNTGS